MNRDQAREFFRAKNARRKLVKDPEQRRENRLLGQLVSMGLHPRLSPDERAKRRKKLRLMDRQSPGHQSNLPKAS